MRLPLLAAAAMLSASLAARADTIYNVNLTLEYGGSLYGTVTYNSVLSQFTGGNLTATIVRPVIPGTPFTLENFVLTSSGANPYAPNIVQGTYQAFSYEASDFTYLDGALFLDTKSNVTGLELCTESVPCNGQFSGLIVVGAYPSGTTNFADIEHISGGTVTEVTPEPSSIALLSTGLLGVVGIVRKRFA